MTAKLLREKESDVDFLKLVWPAGLYDDKKLKRKVHFSIYMYDNTKIHIFSNKKMKKKG